MPRQFFKILFLNDLVKSWNILYFVIPALAGMTKRGAFYESIFFIQKQNIQKKPEN